MSAAPSIFSRLPDSYTEHPDLLKWVKADPCGPLGRICELVDKGTVLDIGAGAGILGRLLKENPDVIADGLDPAIAADNPGVQHYRRFDSCKLEDVLHESRIGTYDWFVLADVIEHTPYPDLFLRALVEKAKPDAKILISTPNIGHVSTRLGLLNGEFDYSKSGILESTHLRFFTGKTLQAVLSASGLKIDRLLCLNRPHYPDALDRMSTRRALAGLLAMNDDAYPMTYQFMAVCSRGQGPIGQTSVIGDATRWWAFKEFAKRRYSKAGLFGSLFK